MNESRGISGYASYQFLIVSVLEGLMQYVSSCRAAMSSCPLLMNLHAASQSDTLKAKTATTRFRPVVDYTRLSYLICITILGRKTTNMPFGGPSAQQHISGVEHQTL